MAPDFKNLRELLSWISKRVCKETTEGRADKRRASRDLAHGFCELLNKEPGISIREEPTVKSANYFCAEIRGKTCVDLSICVARRVVGKAQQRI